MCILRTEYVCPKLFYDAIYNTLIVLFKNVDSLACSDHTQTFVFTIQSIAELCHTKKQTIN